MLKPNLITLYQKAKTGKIKILKLWTEDKYLCAEWGTTGSKQQTTKKECIPMNIDKANATTAPEQAIAELNAKAIKKKKEGYTENINNTEKDIEFTLDTLPKEFVPSKPAKKCPSSILDSKDTFGQRKRNGHCIILVKTGKGINKIYSRRMEDITEYLKDIPIIKASFNSIDNGCMLINEFCYINNKGLDSPRTVAKLVRKKDIAEVNKRYIEFSKVGTFKIVTFDIMYHKDKFIGNTDYLTNRYEILKKYNLTIPKNFFNWKDLIKRAKHNKWEGFVLRIKGSKSYITYTLNGKADTTGAWKYKFVFEEDFVVTNAAIGKAGKHTGLYATFNLAQYVDGELTDFGKCGPGKLKHNELKEMTTDIDSGKLKFPFAIEVEYQSRQEDSGKLEFPQFVRIRYDKSPEECITDFRKI